MCRLLDGVPLAIEIAAQRLPSLPISSLLPETLVPLLDQVDAGALSAHRTCPTACAGATTCCPRRTGGLLHDLVALPDRFALDDVLAGRRGSTGAAPQVAHQLAELADASLVQTLRQGQYRTASTPSSGTSWPARGSGPPRAPRAWTSTRARSVSAAGAAHPAA
ncbi:hypothetical protein SGRIM128S_03190 [Streptomyces griseomycini]